MIDPDSIEEIIDLYENKIGPQNGAKVMQRHGLIMNIKRLITNATSAIAELGFTGRQGENIIVVENTEKIHNIMFVLYVVAIPASIRYSSILV